MDAIERDVMTAARKRTYWHAVFDDENCGAVLVGSQADAESQARAIAKRSSRKSQAYNPDGTPLVFLCVLGPFTMDESLDITRVDLDARASKVREMVAVRGGF